MKTQRAEEGARWNTTKIHENRLQGSMNTKRFDRTIKRLEEQEEETNTECNEDETTRGSE